MKPNFKAFQELSVCANIFSPTIPLASLFFGEM